MPSASGIPQPIVPTPGNQPKPIREQDENENRGKEPKRLLNQFVADDAFQKIVEAFHQPFPEILRARRHSFVFFVNVRRKIIKKKHTIN